MILYVVRHGEPSYADEENIPLTDNGIFQAKSVCRELEKAGVTKIFSSPLRRAEKTASYLAESLNIPIQTADFLSENNSVRYFLKSAEDNNAHWMFEGIIRKNIYTEEIIKSGKDWTEYGMFKGSPQTEGYHFLSDESDRFFSNLGYEHNRDENCYVPVNPNDDVVACFCHGGIASAWIPVLADIPLPVYWRNFSCLDFASYVKIIFEPVAENVCITQIKTFNRVVY